MQVSSDIHATDDSLGTVNVMQLLL